MHYRIGEIIFCSQLNLPSYAAFECAPGTPDAVLEITGEIPPGGHETVTGMIACRKVQDGWFLHGVSSPGVGLIVSEDYTSMRLIRRTAAHASFIEKQLIRTALECLLARRGYVSLHAACILLDGKAVAFTGDSGIGKSTRAVAWQQTFSASLLSGDRPLIDVRQDPKAYGVPWDGKESCYRNEHSPLYAVCEVRRSDSVYIRKLSSRQKRLLLLRQCFIPMWDTETAAIQIKNITQLASRVNIVRIFCGPGKEDAEKLKQLLDQNLFLEEETDMKAKDSFILRNVAGEYMLFPAGDNINQFNGTVLLNEISSFIWEKLQNPISQSDLLAAVMDAYEVDEKKAAADLDTLLEKFRKTNMIEDD